MSYANIPDELKRYRQWVTWMYDERQGTKPTKVPYNPNNLKQLAETDNYTTWGSYEEAVSASRWCSGIGFVLTQNDPYAFIDLDDTEGNADQLRRQISIYKAFNSYSEKSPSGNGLHIIVKGSVPAGRKRSHIEVYSSGRYMTMTGNVFEPKPIAERNELLNILWGEMGSGAAVYCYSGDQDQKATDEQIINQALVADNGEKFKKLMSGDRTDYPSWSEADQALINIIAFYTQNRAQIERIFKRSPLGHRDKANRSSYIKYTINRAFDRMLPPVDIDGLRNQVDLTLAKGGMAKSVDAADLKSAGLNGHPGSSPGAPTTPIVAVPTIDTNPYIPPPGLVGDIANFIYSAAPRQVPEVALAAAISFMAGICGRAYNVSSTGLNQYILLLAPTGSGKESASSGIDKIMASLKLQIPSSSQFIGPAEIASGGALLKYLSGTSTCFLSIVGEMGLRLQQLSGRNATSAEIQLKRAILDLYNKSGQGNMLRPSVYSDTLKNTQPVEAPNVSILGESTPEEFYKIVDEAMVSSGLLPRFTIFEYEGKRPDLNENHASIYPTPELSSRIGTLMANCLALMQANKVINVAYTPEAEKYLREFDKFCTKQINGAGGELTKHLWNRTHIKVLKLSAQVAVGCDFYAPTITMDMVNWAKHIVITDVRKMLAKFEQGVVGENNNETNQIKLLSTAIKQYYQYTLSEIMAYSVPANLFNDRVIPYAYLQRRLAPNNIYRQDKLGSTSAIKRAIQIMVDSGILREVPRETLTSKYGTSMRAFAVSDMGALNN